MTKVVFNIGEDSVYGERYAQTSITAKAVTQRKVDGALITRSTLRQQASEPIAIELASTGLGDAWIISVNPKNGDSTSGYYKVPDVDEINFIELIQVDPGTLEPDAQPDPEWWGVAKSTIQGGAVDANGDLILTRSDNVKINAGHVVGAPGEDGVSIKGDPGDDGDPGVGFSSAEIDLQGDLNLIQTTGDIINVGHVVGKDGVDGDDGANGLDGAILSGEQYVYTVSEVAGRTVSIWDYINSRQQMIYGDTGWITGVLINGWTGEIRYRRVMNRVTVKFRNMSGSAATSTSFMNIPLGYRSLTLRLGCNIGATNQTIGFNASGDLFASLTIPVDTYWSEVSFITDNVWPVA